MSCAVYTMLETGQTVPFLWRSGGSWRVTTSLIHPNLRQLTPFEWHGWSGQSYPPPLWRQRWASPSVVPFLALICHPSLQRHPPNRHQWFSLPLVLPWESQSLASLSAVSFPLLPHESLHFQILQLITKTRPECQGKGHTWGNPQESTHHRQSSCPSPPFQVAWPLP